MQKPFNKINFEKIFKLGMFWRIFYGYLRILLGFILFYFVGTNITNIFSRVITKELSEDKGGISLELLSKIISHVPINITYFIIIYLFFWGIIDVVLSYSLLKHKLWSYPVSILLIIFFVFYEIYRFTHTHSLFLIWIIILDIFIVFLINQEYKKLRTKK